MNEGAFIVGVDGLIGSHLARIAEEKKSLWIGSSRKKTAASGKIRHLDLRDESAIEHLDIAPKIAYLCAAETNLRRCQAEPLRSRKLNVEQTVKLARHLHRRGAQIVFLSSSLVFDGNEPCVPADAPLSPVTEYGTQKAEAEKILAGELDQVAIVRLTKVVHELFPLFIEWLKAMREGRTIHPFSDMLFCPVDLTLVAEELWALSDSFQPGIFQLTGDAELPYARAARLLAECRGLDAGLVHPQTTAQAGFIDNFPKHTVLAHRPIQPRPEPESSTAVLKRIFSSIHLPVRD